MVIKGAMISLIDLEDSRSAIVDGETDYNFSSVLLFLIDW